MSTLGRVNLSLPLGQIDFKITREHFHPKGELPKYQYGLSLDQDTQNINVISEFKEVSLKDLEKLAQMLNNVVIKEREFIGPEKEETKKEFTGFKSFSDFAMEQYEKNEYNGELKELEGLGAGMPNH